MTRWRSYPGHPRSIVDEAGNHVCLAQDLEHAARLVAEHNALIECVDALREMEWLLYAEVGLDQDTRSGQCILRARAALAKLENLK